jgi:hypothetical protein
MEFDAVTGSLLEKVEKVTALKKFGVNKDYDYKFASFSQGNYECQYLTNGMNLNIVYSVSKRYKNK